MSEYMLAVVCMKELLLMLLFPFLTLSTTPSHCMHTQRRIHDFLLFNGLNLERVFDKRVK